MKIAVFVPVAMDCVEEPKIFTGNDAEKKAAKAFFDHTGVEYSVFLAAEDKGEILSSSDTIGTKIITSQLHQTDNIYEDLNKDDIDYVKQVLCDLKDAKYNANQASDKALRLPRQPGEKISDYLSDIYQQLEMVETMISEMYPQAAGE
ncbi:hypothetical protein [Paenibacillus gallinarum]|uniref:Uncharacterized protein n=1 Tax=Paenibacillus gallinarum TaxID=2762232 RepID=A0ABR8T480_9BACL|nr:hypothetical protein [Paenibacillus gallinarum]MBD7970395.1 hypothetical protein [Paenibacillus gallinarum]